jgi:pimeloyl-ACP methyl ester carboxylesterase
MNDAEERIIDLPGGAVRVRDSGGDGPLVVFVHGILVDGRLWDEVWPSVAAAGYRCLIPDLPLGAHRLPLDADADRSPTGQAHRIADMVSEAGDRAVVVGNDSGGAVSQILAAERPEVVDRLILTSADAFRNFPPLAFKPLPLIARSPALLRSVLWTLSRRPMRSNRIPFSFGQVSKKGIPDELADDWFGPLFEDSRILRDAAGFAAGMKPELTMNAAGKLAGFPRPALVAWSADDKFFPVSDGRKLAETIPGAKFVLIEDSYTFSAIDQPEALAGAIVGFLEETGDA